MKTCFEVLMPGWLIMLQLVSLVYHKLSVLGQFLKPCYRRIGNMSLVIQDTSLLDFFVIFTHLGALVNFLFLNLYLQKGAGKHVLPLLKHEQFNIDRKCGTHKPHIYENHSDRSESTTGLKVAQVLRKKAEKTRIETI